MDSSSSDSEERECSCGNTAKTMCRLCDTLLCDDCGHEIYPGTDSNRVYCDYHYENM